MTREQQVKAALKLSKLRRNRHEAARAIIENALDIMGSTSNLHRMVKLCRSKAVTEARGAYYRALRKLQIAHKALLATGSGMVGDLEHASIENAIAAFEARGEPVRYELYPDAAGRWTQGFAVALAYELLMHWWSSDEFISTTRKGSWWRLSAILYGDPDADLFRHLCKFKPERSPFRTRTG